MTLKQTIWICIGLIAVAITMYIILPKLKGNSGLIGRTLIFSAIIIYLSIDFYLKGKYGYLVFLLLGSAAFGMMMKYMKKR